LVDGILIVTSSDCPNLYSIYLAENFDRAVKDQKSEAKQIAEKFGVSEMQIYRIKRGEIWFHIKTKNEPDTKKYLSYLKNKSKKLDDSGNAKENNFNINQALSLRKKRKNKKLSSAMEKYADRIKASLCAERAPRPRHT
jgi:hypothetical protein